MASVVILLLNKVFGGLRFTSKKKIEPMAPITSAKVSLDDPIGALCVVAQKYNDILFLKDLAFLEVQLFGRNSSPVIDLFRSAEGDPRPEVCASCANKIFFLLAKLREQKISNGSWTDEQEETWRKGIPKELRSVFSKYERAS